MGTPAVLVIDMLNDYFKAGPLKEQREALVHNINSLLSQARACGFSIIWVRQEWH